jgi:uncharacterized membrane protein (UPF0127 family)
VIGFFFLAARIMKTKSTGQPAKSVASRSKTWGAILAISLLAVSGGAVLANVFLDWASRHQTVDSPIVAAAVEPFVPAPAVANFSQIQACIISKDKQLRVTMYLANTDALRAKGLQGVSGLPPMTGMLFVYESKRSPEAKFWMYETSMNLDIAYLDEQGFIRTIQQMPACNGDRDTCPTYPAGVPFLAAAEFPQGFFRRNGITVGDRLSADYFSDCQQDPPAS